LYNIYIRQYQKKKEHTIRLGHVHSCSE